MLHGFSQLEEQVSKVALRMKAKALKGAAKRGGEAERATAKSHWLPRRCRKKSMSLRQLKKSPTAVGRLCEKSQSIQAGGQRAAAEIVKIAEGGVGQNMRKERRADIVIVRQK